MAGPVLRISMFAPKPLPPDHDTVYVTWQPALCANAPGDMSSETNAAAHNHSLGHSAEVHDRHMMILLRIHLQLSQPPRRTAPERLAFRIRKCRSGCASHLPWCR